MNTLLLDRTTWDLCLNAAGDIAVATDPYSVAQDAASAVRLFLGELWYDTALGVPYFGQILGANPSVQFIKAQIVAAASSVPGVVNAQCFISSISGRQVTGQLQITDTNGTTTTVSF